MRTTSRHPVHILTGRYGCRLQADGSSIKLEQAYKERKNIFHTATIKGGKPKTRGEIKVPYKCYHTGEYTELSGAALCAQIDRLVPHSPICLHP